MEVELEQVTRVDSYEGGEWKRRSRKGRRTSRRVVLVGGVVYSKMLHTYYTHVYVLIHIYIIYACR